MPPDPTILAFDTSAAHCAAALLSEGRIVRSQTESMPTGQAERLIPMLEEVLAAAGLSWRGIDAIAVGTGPGNFTGLRIAVAAARGFALALGIPAVGVSAFRVMAAQAQRPEGAGGAAGPLLVTLAGPRGALHAAPVALAAGAAGGAAVAEAGAPFLLDPSAPALPAGLLPVRVAGTAGRAVGAALGLPGEDLPEIADAGIIARLAAARLATGDPVPRPAPLYVRPADAAPPSQPPPVILP
ncbi:MAG: tRNA (adenosine(37)-N6)-threonylcarbamoyltransferase complex dimerization subunit type 1 TsaB [Rhodobacteraceae bacterium]|nr:tRNA (adenosine(37)-N6)-threonylcarbamoyltransferase complex dimerization subunit type 1 TsaB [Paracoccaceae bacterium]